MLISLHFCYNVRTIDQTILRALGVVIFHEDPETLLAYCIGILSAESRTQTRWWPPPRTTIMLPWRVLLPNQKGFETVHLFFVRLWFEG